MPLSGSPLRVGIAGLGTVSAQVLRAFPAVEGVVLAAAADLRPEARAAFTARYDLPAFASVEELCRGDAVDAVWIATPNHVHAEHAIVAGRSGKHVLCEKPIAVTLEECDRMVAAAESAGVRLLAAHSKIFDTPVQAMRALIASGRLGRVIQINALVFNDWLQRPRLAPELDTARGGGVVLRQGPHIVDIVRYLAGGEARELRALAGRRDANFDAEGNFAALLEFTSGAVASIGFNGYGYFDGTELTWGIGVYGDVKAGIREAKPRPRLKGPLSADEKYVSSAFPAGESATKARKRMPFFGLTIVSCERGVIRQSPDGLYLYDANGCTELAVPANPERAAELTELRDAIAGRRPVFPDGRWGAATLEVCLAILQSTREGRSIALARQGPPPR